jgi:hypothetical protein
MATTLKWATPEAIASALTTDLNSLANAAYSAASGAIDNLTDLYEYIELELNLAAQGSARSSGGTVEVWMEKQIDGTNYEDRANTAFGHQFLASFPLDAATTTRRLVLSNIPIPPAAFKLSVRNNTGQAFASSGSTLKYRRYNEQGV